MVKIFFIKSIYKKRKMMANIILDEIPKNNKDTKVKQLIIPINYSDNSKGYN